MTRISDDFEVTSSDYFEYDRATEAVPNSDGRKFECWCENSKARTTYPIDNVPFVAAAIGTTSKTATIIGTLPMRTSGWETDEAGELWLVLRELRGDAWVEIERWNARDVTL